VFEVLKRRLAEATASSSPQAVLPPGVRIERVRVTETGTTWAEYSP
jgi:6-pyruvoyltetrahydropterin/6-carboxytetrahydropterin synthase